ncbi:MAG: ATP-binding protein [Phascolarctobacterium sp.]|nr:ATP-binding protein [Phascolarctobacterium sp.]
MTRLINRPKYIDELLAHKDVDLVKIVTGIRRCGKSSILDLYHQKLLDLGVDNEHILHMNMESMRYSDLKDYKNFYEFVSEHIPKSGKAYLMFDELQVVAGWEKAIESFRLDFDVDIYITGSNAYMLSTDFSTFLSGRYVEIKVLPLSFKEFITFNEFAQGVTKAEMFKKYLQFGGMPILKDYKFDELASFQALEGIYSTIILKDILQRNGQTDQALLQKIFLFVCDNLGSVTSPNNIGNVLANSGELITGKIKAVAGKTVERYLDMLCRAFICYPVSRFDVKGKQLLKTLGKYYLVDLGFRQMLLGNRRQDLGHLLENVVYVELLRRGYNVYIGKVDDTEVDFIAEKFNERVYLQVSLSLIDASTYDREMKPLQKIRDNHPKKVLTMDPIVSGNDNGVEIVNVLDWLLE